MRTVPFRYSPLLSALFFPGCASLPFGNLTFRLSAIFHAASSPAIQSFCGALIALSVMPLTGCGGEGPDDIVEAAVRDLYAGRGEEFMKRVQIAEKDSAVPSAVFSSRGNTCFLIKTHILNSS